MAFSLQSIKKARRRVQAAPSLPPLGSYDPSVLLQYGENKRTADDAQSTYDLGKAQAQDDYAIQTGRLGQSLQDSLADILTGKQRNQQDYTTATANLAHQYGAQATQQAEGDLRGNVESAGILARQQAIRQQNQAHDQSGLDTSLQRALADSTTSEARVKQDADNKKADLALALSRAYGSGKKGNPLGTNTLNLTQTKANALAGNLDLSGVAYQQAAANGYRFPKRRKALIV